MTINTIAQEEVIHPKITLKQAFHLKRKRHAIALTLEDLEPLPKKEETSQNRVTQVMDPTITFLNKFK